MPFIFSIWHIIMISKQLVLGGTLLLGGSVALFALTQKGDDTKNATATEKVATAPQDDVARPQAQPLTTDLETERRLLEQKRQEREARTLEQERLTQELLAQQEKATQDALKKAQDEQAQIEAKKQAQNPEQTPVVADTPVTPSVQTRPEVIKAQQEAERLEAQKEAERKQAEQAKKQSLLDEQAKAKALEQVKAKEKQAKEQELKAKEATKTQTVPKGHHLVKQGDTLLKVSRQYNVPVSVIASVNNMGRNDALAVGKTIKIPSKADVAKAEKAQTEKAQQAQKDTKKPAEQEKKSNKVPRHYSVQVGLLPKDKASELAKQYRQAGYKVQTSQTSRGVRVLVGSTKTEAEANALKNKIVKDSRVKTDGAWVKEVDEINAP